MLIKISPLFFLTNFAHLCAAPLPFQLPWEWPHTKRVHFTILGLVINQNQSVMCFVLFCLYYLILSYLTFILAYFILLKSRLEWKTQLSLCTWLVWMALPTTWKWLHQMIREWGRFFLVLGCLAPILSGVYIRHLLFFEIILHSLSLPLLKSFTLGISD